jgi:hypothetical protein
LLNARFNFAAENQIDEFDFFIDLLADGITLEDIKMYIPEQYEYSKTFLEEHGFI